jgi:hypothetical protein
MADTGAMAVVQLYESKSASGTFPVRRTDRQGWQTVTPDMVSELPIPCQLDSDPHDSDGAESAASPADQRGPG